MSRKGGAARIILKGGEGVVDIVVDFSVKKIGCEVGFRIYLALVIFLFLT